MGLSRDGVSVHRLFWYLQSVRKDVNSLIFTVRMSQILRDSATFKMQPNSDQIEEADPTEIPRETFGEMNETKEMNLQSD